MRIVHIQRSADVRSGQHRYDIIDAGRYGEDAGAADASRSLTREGVGDWLIREGLSYSAVERTLNELDQTGFAQVQIPPRVGPRTVRAWFDTVFNPLIQSLELELVLVEKRNWTFSFRPPTLELIRPVRQYLDGRAWANLEQMLQLRVLLEENLKEHDVLVEQLLRAVVALHEALTTSREFVELCHSLLEPEKLEAMGVKSIEHLFGAYPPSDRLSLIAQYVVNNSGEQASHYSTAKLWNRYRQVLLKALTFRDVAEHYAGAIQIGEQLASRSRGLANSLKELRLQLALEHDIPYVIADVGQPTR